MDARDRFCQLLDNPEIILAPGIFDGLSAELTEQAGFKALYASGGAIARSAGLPDLGLLSFNEVTTRLQQIVEVTSLPIIADADTGYGNALNVFRTIKIYERLGIAALHIEDQTFPKRCGHLNDQILISTHEMIQKIKTAVSARTDPRLKLIIRTDAIAVESFDQALIRAQAYADAGADILFMEAPQSLEQIEQIPKVLSKPVLINMFYGGKTPLVPLDRLKKWGYRIVIIPSDLQRAAIFAMKKTLTAIHTHGNSESIADQLTTFAEREKIIGTTTWLEKATDL